MGTLSKFFLFWGMLSLISITFIQCEKTESATPVSPPPPPPPPPASCSLSISVQNEFTTLPAKVSMFFKVDDCNNNPIADLTESDFTIYEQGSNDSVYREYSEHEAIRKISDNSQLFVHNTFLVLDLSGSVTANNLASLKNAAKQFIDVVIPTANSSYPMGIWWFDGEDILHPLTSLTTNPTTLKNAIDNITPTISADNSTDLYGAVIKSTTLAEDILTQSTLDIAAASVVIFTDGTDQASRYSTSLALNTVSNSNDNITHFTIGLGDEIDDTILKQIGKDGSAFANNTNDLNAKFAEIAQYVFNEANSYYLFEYCSPKRAGTNNKLKLEIKKDSKFGMKETQFDASQFAGGCSL